VNCYRVPDSISNQVLLALQWAYRKHHMQDDSIGSSELSNILCDALCEIMTNKGFQNWLDNLEENKLVYNSINSGHY
jgi:hypothetical protein